MSANSDSGNGGASTERYEKQLKDDTALGANRAERLTHLAGYAAIVAVLGVASWSSAVGWVVSFLFVGVVGVYFAYVGYDILTDRVRAQAEAAAVAGTAVPDGGRDE